MDQKYTKGIYCDECGAKLLTNHSDRDHRGLIYCRSCGLVYDPYHEMGRGIKGLILWLRRNGAAIDMLRRITQVYESSGLRDARLYAVRLLEEKL